MKEKTFTTKFIKWLKQNPEMPTSAFEIKITKGNNIPFSAFRPHQLDALKMVKRDRLMYKIPDDAIAHKPFDLFLMRGDDAFVVIFFEKSKVFYLIDINVFWHHKLRLEKVGQKSLSEDYVKKISFSWDTQN